MISPQREVCCHFFMMLCYMMPRHVLRAQLRARRDVMRCITQCVRACHERGARRAARAARCCYSARCFAADEHTRRHTFAAALPYALVDACRHACCLIIYARLPDAIRRLRLMPFHSVLPFHGLIALLPPFACCRYFRFSYACLITPSAAEARYAAADAAATRYAYYAMLLLRRRARVVCCESVEGIPRLPLRAFLCLFQMLFFFSCC